MKLENGVIFCNNFFLNIGRPRTTWRRIVENEMKVMQHSWGSLTLWFILNLLKHIYVIPQKCKKKTTLKKLAV